MEEFFAYIAIEIAEEIIAEAIDIGVKYVVRQGKNAVGQIVTEIGYMLDTDKDGEGDEFQLLGELPQVIPNLDNGFCLCDRDGELGIGVPYYELIDGIDIAEYLDTGDAPFNMPTVTATDDGFLLDVDFDGDVDDVLVPMFGDCTGDSVSDWGWIVDYNGDSVPDASPDAPFYAIGSEQYEIYLKQTGQEDNGIMTKEINNYTVTEGLLLLSLLINAVWFFRSFFKRENIFGGGARI